MKNREIITLDNTSVIILKLMSKTLLKNVSAGVEGPSFCASKKKMKFLFNPQIKKEKNLTCAVPKIEIPTVNFQLNRTH